MMTHFYYKEIFPYFTTLSRIFFVCHKNVPWLKIDSKNVWAKNETVRSINIFFPFRTIHSHIPVFKLSLVSGCALFKKKKQSKASKSKMCNYRKYKTAYKHK